MRISRDGARASHGRGGRGGVLLVPEGRRERRRGLLAIGPLPHGHLLLLDRARMVHAVGLHGTTLIAFVDARMRIVAVRRLRPGRVAGPVRGARHVVEAADGTDLRAGDALHLLGRTRRPANRSDRALPEDGAYGMMG